MRIYVGTYGKYNNGSLEGEWLDLEDYSSKEEFLEACQELHGEGEHEFMFQDWEDVPAAWVGESWISGDAWKFLELKDYERSPILAICGYDQSIKADQWQDWLDQFHGEWNTLEDYAWHYLKETGAFIANEFLERYFDIEKFTRDLSFDLVTVNSSDGQVLVFSNY